MPQHSPAADRALNALSSISRDLAHAVRSLAKDASVHAGLRALARHRHGRVRRARDLQSRDHGAGARHQHRRADRAAGAPARPAPRQSRRVGARAVVLSGLPGVAGRRHRHGHHRVGHGVQPVRHARRRTATAPRRVATLYVSANYFSTFGVSLARGPGFDPATDDAPSAEPRVVVSHDFWRSRLASDPDIVGKSVTIDGVPHTVVGIAPEDFRGHFHFFQAPSSLLFIPLERHPRLRANPSLRDDRTLDWVRIHGRLDPGVDLTRANAPGVGGGRRSGAAISRDQRIQGRHRRAVLLAGRGRPSGVAARVQHAPRPGGRGAPDRVPEHLRA